VEETTGPCVDRGNGVGGGLFSLLVLSVVTGNSTVSSLSFNTAAWGQQNGGHQTERTVTLGNDIGLDITIVVFTGPNKTT